MIISIFGKTGVGKTILSRMIAKYIGEKTKTNIFEYSPFEELIFDELEFISTNSTIVINEMQIFNLFINDTDLIKIITGHRHYNLNLIYNSQRPAMVKRSLTALSDTIFCFRLTEERDLDYVKFFGSDVDLIRNLKDFNFVDIMTNQIFDLTKISIDDIKKYLER